MGFNPVYGTTYNYCSPVQYSSTEPLGNTSVLALSNDETVPVSRIVVRRSYYFILREQYLFFRTTDTLYSRNVIIRLAP